MTDAKLLSLSKEGLRPFEIDLAQELKTQEPAGLCMCYE